MTDAALTQERLKELLDYDSESGVFKWRVCRGPCHIGTAAGTKNKLGYTQVTIDNKIYLAHRLAWLYFYGCFPANKLDHVNRIRDDNRIENLRAATQRENKQNVSMQRNNTSGAMGVCWDKSSNKWRAYVRADGRLMHLGLHTSIEAARAARASGKAKHHKFNPTDCKEPNGRVFK